LVDVVHAKQPRLREDALDERDYCLEVERWVCQLRGGLELVSPALRLAARAQHFERRALPRDSYPMGREGYLQWRAAAKRRQGERLVELLSSTGLEESVLARTSRLVAKALPLDKDADMQTLEDAACLVFLSHELELFQSDKDDQKLTDILRKTWAKMSRPAQGLALGLEYSPRNLGCLVEAIASQEGLEVTKQPMVAPRLPAATVVALRESWAQVPKEKFGQDFFERLYAEDEELKTVFDYPVTRPENMWKVVQRFVDLLDIELVPRLESMAHAVAALSRYFGRLRMSHMAPIKRALVHTVKAYMPVKEKKLNTLAWEAFFYSLAAVAAPYLVMNDNLEEFAAATAASLPTPGGGPHAGAIAAHGAALLEMSLGITKLSQGASQSPEEVVGKLHEARGWLLNSVRDDVNAYCGLLSSVYARSGRVTEVAEAGAESSKGVSAEEAERRRWLRRATEVPLRVAEVSVGAAIACLDSRSTVKRSLKGDWIAGVKLLRCAWEISMKNVAINIVDLDKGAGDLDARLMRMRETPLPWEDLCDI